VNAAILAAQILATADAALRRRLTEFKEKMAQDVVEKSARMKKQFRL
jgi:phosphoribosylcarboxyaminoimidazole (NCAIR) mutase